MTERSQPTAIDFDDSDFDMKAQEKPMNEMTSPTFVALAKALVAAQAGMTKLAQNAESNTGTYSFQYATLDEVIQHVREPLTSNGIWFWQSTQPGADGKMYLVTTLFHVSGEFFTSWHPVELTGAKMQDIGSKLTYIKRYALLGILGLFPAGEDDDARKADGIVGTTNQLPIKIISPPATPAQRKAAEVWAKAATNEIKELDSTNDIRLWKSNNDSRLSALNEKHADLYQTVFQDLIMRTDVIAGAGQARDDLATEVSKGNA